MINGKSGWSYVKASSRAYFGGSSMLFANDGMEIFISSQEDSWIAGLLDFPCEDAAFLKAICHNHLRSRGECYREGHASHQLLSYRMLSTD